MLTLSQTLRILNEWYNALLYIWLYDSFVITILIDLQSQKLFHFNWFWYEQIVTMKLIRTISIISYSDHTKLMLRFTDYFILIP